MSSYNYPAGRFRQAPPSKAEAAYPSRRAAVLERGSTRLVRRAADAQVDITYLGITPLFMEPRAYFGPTTDWVIAPATDLSDAVVPRAEREALTRLVRAGVDFPLVYIAHEIPKNRLALPAADGAVTLSRADAAQAVGPVPEPVGATDLASRLGGMSQSVLQVLGKALPIAGAIAAAPFVLAGAALGTVLAGLDPIVFGVIPAGPATAGQPAAWYVLAQWNWPDSQS